MPWKIVRDDPGCPSSRPWGVRKVDGNDLAGCHETKKKAARQIAALEANEGASRKEDLSVSTTQTIPDGFERELGPGGLEVRTTPAELIEARAANDDGKQRIVGYGAVYDSPTTIRGLFRDWDEEVAAGAFAKSIRESDVRSMFNHDINWLLGRTKAGTLHLSEDKTGLRYDVDINPDDVNALSVWAKVDRGDVSGSSIWFRVTRQEFTLPSDENDLERPKRRILEGRLFETGPVVFPAFTKTTSGTARALDGVLRAAGIDNAMKRAELGAELLANPDDVEAELRALLDEQPELRAAVCSCQTDPSRAATVADGAPGHDEDRAADKAPDPLMMLQYRARARRLDAMMRGAPLG